MKINETRIKYILVVDKLYEVEKISFFDFSVQAKETDKTIDDVPAEEVFELTDLKEFNITLRNWHGNVVDFVDYVKNRKMMLNFICKLYRHYVLMNLRLHWLHQ